MTEASQASMSSTVHVIDDDPRIQTAVRLASGGERLMFGFPDLIPAHRSPLGLRLKRASF